jgi:hypothetical protein
MIKFVSFLSLFSFIYLSISAQKVKTSNEEIAFSYMRLPSQQLDESFTTYSRHIIGGAALGNYGVNVISLAGNLKIEGKQHVPSGGHLLLEVVVENPVITTKKVEKVTSKVKDKDGNEMSVTSYEPKLSYALPISYRLIDFENNEILAKEYQGLAEKITVTLKAQPSNSAAEKALNSSFKSKLSSDINSALGSISNYISANYGYTVKPMKERVLSIKPEKHSEFARFQKSVDDVRSTFKTVKPGIDLAETKSKIQSSLDYWDATQKKVDANDKKVNALKFACLYNLTRTSLWLEDLDAAKKYHAGLKKLNMKKFEVAQLGSAVDFVSGLLEANPSKGLYFPYELKDAAPPESVTYTLGESTSGTGINTSSIQVPSSYDLKQGKVHLSGVEKNAAFVIPPKKVEGGATNLAPDNGFKIYTHDGSDFQEMDILASMKAGDSFSFDKVKYLLSKAEKGKYFDIKELIYDSEKITFYTVNSMNRVPMFPKFRIRKSNSDTEWEPKGLSESAWKKSLKEFFSDCSSIATNVIDKESLTNKEFPKILCDYYVKSCK